MAESTVSVDGTTHTLPHPFFVVGTQNPLESHGVYPLAESQLDRFMLQLPFDFPKEKDEFEIYQTQTIEKMDQIHPLLSLNDVLDIREAIPRVQIEKTILEYVNRLVRGSRTLPEIATGVSIRGGLHFLTAARSLAFIRGRDFVTPLDVQDVAVAALAHRHFVLTMGQGALLKRTTQFQSCSDKHPHLNRFPRAKDEGTILENFT